MVFSSYSEKQVDDAYEKGFKDGCKRDSKYLILDYEKPN